MRSVFELELDDARRISDATQRAAQAAGFAIAVAVCDAAGRLILFQRDDGVPGISVDLAPAKARTAALLGVASGQIEQAVAHGHPALVTMPGCVLLGGGTEIRIDGRVVGAIGVSGAPSGEQDDALARAGLAALDAPRPT